MPCVSLQVKKWLGQERVRFMKLTNGPSAVEEVNNFKCGTVWKLLIASYEVRLPLLARLARGSFAEVARP
jgi:hypothetical protein